VFIDSREKGHGFLEWIELALSNVQLRRWILEFEKSRNLFHQMKN